MILTRPSGLVGLSLLLLAAAPAASATAKAKPRPKVSSIAPLTAGIGDQLTIKGKNFILGKRRNTVLFKAPNGHVTSAKSVLSTRKVIYVVVPTGLQNDMTVKDRVVQPATFRVRILSKRFAKRFTALSGSPKIGPASTILGPGKVGSVPAGPVVPPDCDHDGVLDSVDGDDDNDLLSDTDETSLGLNPCDEDTDGDGVADGYEYKSARDLNSTEGTRPYPGKRPYPNPLDGTDAGTDYDGEGLTTAQEYLMWTKFGDHTLNLNYSAGRKRSLAPSDMTTDGNRDVDTDGLRNWDEFNGPMQPEWWTSSAGYPTEKAYTPAPYLGTSAVDQDSDGDGLMDGLDDIDHDGWNNASEIDRTASGYRVQPFNPCLPNYNANTCSSEHPPPPPESYPPFDSYPLPASPIVWP